MNNFAFINKIPSESENAFIAILDCNRCKTLSNFLDEIGRVFIFPNYYGKNMNALDECINDLEWINSLQYTLVFEKFENFLIDESEETFVSIIDFFSRVSKEWYSVPNYEGEDTFRKKALFNLRIIEENDLLDSRNYKLIKNIG
jgi:RNAse (barnase) inhibitor barstar